MDSPSVAEGLQRYWPLATLLPVQVPQDGYFLYFRRQHVAHSYHLILETSSSLPWGLPVPHLSLQMAFSHNRRKSKPFTSSMDLLPLVFHRKVFSSPGRSVPPNHGALHPLLSPHFISLYCLSLLLNLSSTHLQTHSYFLCLITKMLNHFYFNLGVILPKTFRSPNLFRIAYNLCYT